MFYLQITPLLQAVRRLRERGEPIRLFGESDRDVCIRLRYGRMV